MSYDGWKEEPTFPPGRPHDPYREPLLPISTASGPRPTRSTSSVPSRDLEKAIKIYFEWFTSSHLDPQQRYNMMLNSTITEEVNREITLIRIIRQLCPALKVDMERSDRGWSEKHNTAY